jgi:hypothetical protein
VSKNTSQRKQKPLPEDQIAGETGKRTMAKTENQNALKHGAFAEAVILPQEDPKEFEELLASLNDEWNPDGPSEIHKVESIAIGLWRKRRFKRYIKSKLAKVAMIDSWTKRFREKDYDELVQVLEDIESGVPGCVTEDNLSDKLGRHWADRIKKLCPRKNYDNDSAWLTALARLICDLLDEKILREGQERTIDEEMSGEAFADREQSFEERIDSKIDRDIKALGQIKTMKAIGIGQRRAPITVEPLKQIESPPIQIVEGK